MVLRLPGLPPLLFFSHFLVNYKTNAPTSCTGLGFTTIVIHSFNFDGRHNFFVVKRLLVFLPPHSDKDCRRSVETQNTRAKVEMHLTRCWDQRLTRGLWYYSSRLFSLLAVLCRKIAILSASFPACVLKLAELTSFETGEFSGTVNTWARTSIFFCVQILKTIFFGSENQPILNTWLTGLRRFSLWGQTSGLGAFDFKVRISFRSGTIIEGVSEFWNILCSWIVTLYWVEWNVLFLLQLWPIRYTGHGSMITFLQVVSQIIFAFPSTSHCRRKCLWGCFWLVFFVSSQQYVLLSLC